MPIENTELIRAFLPPAGTDIARLLRDRTSFATAVEAVGGLFDPDLESVPAWQGDVPAYRGIDGFRTMWLDWLEPWAAYYSTVEEMTSVGDRVVVLVRDRARRDESEAEVELISGSVWTVRDAKIHRVHFYASREQLFEATGLPPIGG